MNHKRLLIFDLDGTLLDSAMDVHLCINKALMVMGRPEIDMKQTKKAIGPGSWEFYRTIFGDDRERIEEFRSHFLSEYEERCLVHTKPFAGIPELLEQLSGMDMVVATNKKNSTTHRSLQGTGLARFFKWVVTPEMVKKIKPAPDMVQLALGHFTCRAEDAMVIGDTDNDLLAGQAAGVCCALATWGYGDMKENIMLGPDYILSQPRQLLDVLELTTQAAA
jgi:HAD superfamily hydrolase (TIGR01509 family)